MDALALLLTRSSQPRLQAPAPEGEVLENIMQAALRAPDHRCLTPWRFIVCEGAGLKKLGEIFEMSAINDDQDPNVIERALKLPMRAPMVIIAIAKFVDNEKVPWVEQVASASCAVNNMQMAALAQGFNGIWRTGSYAQNEHVKQALSCSEQDEIVGFLYLGSTTVSAVTKPPKQTSVYFERWR